ELVHLLREENNVKPIYTDLQDMLLHEEITEYNIVESFQNLQSYKDRVEAFIRKNKNHLVIDKLYRNLPINAFELQQLEQYLIVEALDSKEKFVQEFGEQPLGTFIRRIIGLEQEAINHHFTEFIKDANLSSRQIKFVDTVVRYFTKNGFLDPASLTSPPFTDMDDSGVIGLFEDNSAHKLISLIKEVNNNAEGA